MGSWRTWERTKLGFDGKQHKDRFEPQTYSHTTTLHELLAKSYKPKVILAYKQINSTLLKGKKNKVQVSHIDKTKNFLGREKGQVFA